MAAQADGAVLHDAAFGFEQEQVVELGPRVGIAHVCAGGGPAVERRLAVKAAVGGVAVLAFDPGPEVAVERVEAVDGVEVEVGEPAGFGA